MSSKRFLISSLAALFVSAASAAHAADWSPPPPPPEPCCNNWYLRGYVGVGINGDTNLDYTTVTNATLQHSDISDSYFIGGGVGYNVNNWLRLEGTFEYRAKSRVYALVTYPPGGIDEYQGYLNSWLFLANAFVDLGTWECFTPFIGAGVGGAYNTLADFSDVNPNGGYGFGRNPSEWNFAWALYAGVSYSVTKNFNIDLTYRYLNVGSITDTVDCSVTCTQDSFKFKDLTSSDIMLGLRWTCCEAPAPEPRYVYTPPPPPPPPPLRSRG
jgi:opacity protein-like surface antigen